MGGPGKITVGHGVEVGVPPRMQLRHRRTALFHSIQRRFVRFHKERDVDVVFEQRFHRRFHPVRHADHIQSPLRGHLFPVLRYQSDPVRFKVAGNLDNLRVNRALQIHRQRGVLDNPSRIVIGNMPPILSEVNRNLIRTSQHHRVQGMKRVRIMDHPGLF